MGVSALKSEGRLHSDSLTKAEILNNQFKSVFTKEDSSDIPKLFGPNYPEISDLVITQRGVEKLLSQLNPSKAAGPDQIPCRILRELSQELAPILSALFQQSLDTGTLPSSWSKAFVTPVFKKGSKCMPENYRPVSLTCVSCKLYEHIICKHIRNHLDKHEILSALNHGFRAKHSCETQLLLTLQDLMAYRDQNVQIDIAILDFSKAFDTDPHDRLLGKLEFYGITGPVLRWTAAFLKNREQRVVVDGKHSSAATVDSGVPQGTVLGPLLFLLHINDLPSVVSSQVRLFADDCLMYRPIRSMADQDKLQLDLAALELWGDTWGMRFNATKCNIMRISRSRNPLTRMYSLCGHVLAEVDIAKYLGINISSELSWSPHVSSVASRANSTLGFLRRNLRQCPMKLKETAYIALIRSSLEYAASIWDPYLKRDIDALERVQRRAARFTKGDYGTTSSVTAMLTELGWHQLADRRRDLRLALLYKIVHGHVAVPVDSLNLTHKDSRTRSKHGLTFRHPSAKTNELKNFFINRTVPDWNLLPASTVEASSVESFKARLAGRPQRD